MSGRRELVTLLEEAGARETPAPDVEFVAGLEARLLGDVATLEDSTPLVTLLEEAGARETPAPRVEFVAGLEARLLGDVSTVTRPTPLVAHDGMRSRHRRIGARPVLVGVAAGFAAIVLTGALAGWFGQNVDQRKLELASAFDTTVVLPDGTQVQGQEGQNLPEGTVVRTGPDGHAEVGKVNLGPGQQAVVEAGQLTVTVPELSLPTVPSTLPDLLP